MGCQSSKDTQKPKEKPTEPAPIKEEQTAKPDPSTINKHVPPEDDYKVDIPNVTSE